MSKLATSIVLGATLLSTNAQATIVEFVTSVGNIRVNLHDQTTPKTVENFLSYVEDGDYQDTVIHRVEPNFVVQGGGFKYKDGFDHDAIDTEDAVENEPKLSNVKGTIAMAKIAGNPNSATSQWFFNINDNSANLDIQNGGFTVFGQVIEEDMAILEEIEALSRCVNSFGATPMVDFTNDQCSSGETPTYDNFVTISRIDIIDATEVTDTDLPKTPNTLINQPTDGDTDNNNSSGGGGSLFWLTLLTGLGLLRRQK
ncbi:peptidylprolyl isomerase [Thalassotalea euphylliae]|uniref:peptidylprolyl isomerase n=1 Tax=Thalassotalea euphylliae TaxID=1655234 RepID=UPI00363598EB